MLNGELFKTHTDAQLRSTVFGTKKQKTNFSFLRFLNISSVVTTLIELLCHDWFLSFNMFEICYAKFAFKMIIVFIFFILKRHNDYAQPRMIHR